MGAVRKIVVEVVVKYTRDGERIPVQLVWEDGRVFEIDRVIDMKKAASLKAGGCGLRYRCKVRGKETCLWLEDEKWFMEVQ